MSSYIANIKITQRDIIKNWWKLNYFIGGIVPSPYSLLSERALFNSFAVNDVRGLVADGYHVATLEDFGTLCVNITQLNIQNFGYRRFYDGLFVPEEGFALWTSDIDEGSWFNACQETYNGSCDSVASYNPNDGHIVRVVKDDDVDPGQYVGNDGKVYPTIKIGNQVWVFGNLDETKYRFSGVKYQLSGNYPNDGEMQLIFNDVEGIPYPAILLHNIINGITISEIVEQILLDENYQYLKELGYIKVSYDSTDDKLAIYTLGISVFSGWGFWPLPYGTGLIISDYMTNSIPEITDNTEWTETTDGARCYYNNEQ